MKILFIAPRFHTNQFPIIKFLKKKNKVNFLSQYVGQTENHKLLKPDICSGVFFPFNLNFKNLDISTSSFIPNIFFLIKYFKKKNPEIVIIRHHYKIFSYVCIFILKIMKKKIIIYDQNEITLNVKKKFLNKLWFFSEFFFRTYILNIPWVSPINNFKDKKIKSNCFYLPFAVDKNLKKNVNRTNKKITFLSIGKFRKRKNLIMLIRSVETIIKKFNFKIKLIIVGEATNEEEKKNYNNIINFIKIKKLQKIIFLKTNVPHSNIGKFYKGSDIFVLPSTREPAAISVLEAASFGLPVILSNTSGTRCYFKNNFNAKFFKDNDQTDLQNKMIFFLKSITNIKKYNQNIIKSFNKTMSLENYEKNFKKILQKI